MADNFRTFASIVNANFQAIMEMPHVFVTGLDGNVLFETNYLNAFPDGTNPVFLTKTEHDCTECSKFIRRAGSVIGIDAEGTRHTAWDTAAAEAPEPYRTVATTLSLRA